MQVCTSPSRKSDLKGKSACCRPCATTVARMLLKTMLRTTGPGRVLAVVLAGALAAADVALRVDVRPPEIPIEIGPVTSFMIRLENRMFSKRDWRLAFILIGQ